MAPILGLLTTRSNIPNLRLPQTLEYLHIYALERAYIEPRRQDETLKAFKLRAYDTLRVISTAETILRVVRVMQLQLEIEWSIVWRNLHLTWTSEGAKSARYMVMHDLIATNACACTKSD